MNEKERYEREAKAKGGSVPPDLRRDTHRRTTHAGSEANVHQDDQRREQRQHMAERTQREDRESTNW